MTPPILTCRSCNHTGNDYSQQLQGKHLGAYCGKCKKWIQWLPQEEPKIHFGKYKDSFVRDVTDLEYLKWIVDKVHLSKRYMDSVKYRISELESKK